MTTYAGSHTFEDKSYGARLTVASKPGVCVLMEDTNLHTYPQVRNSWRGITGNPQVSRGYPEQHRTARRFRYGLMAV